MTARFRDIHPDTTLVAALAIVLGVKLAVLLALGPVVAPDSNYFEQVARGILGGSLGRSDLHDGFLPDTLFRVLGYSWLTAGAMIVADGWHRWLLVAVQLAASTVALIYAWRLAVAAGLRGWVRLFAVAAPALSLPLMVDTVILADSLHASLVSILLCLLAIRAVEQRGLSVADGLTAGTLLAGAFLLREGTIVPAFALLALAVIAAVPRTRPVSPLRAVLAVALVFLPALTVHQIYGAWNRDRVGEAVISTGAQTAIAHAVFRASRYVPDVLDQTTQWGRIAHEHVKTFDFEEAVSFSNVLYSRHGIDAIQQSHLAFDAFFRAWRDHPQAMARIPMDHVRSNLAQLSFRPIESIRDLMIWAYGDDRGFARMKGSGNGRWWNAPLAVVDGFCKAVSIVLFAAFLLVTPWRAATDWDDPTARMGLGVWLFGGALFSAYALVHLETRYMVPVMAAVTIVAISNLMWLRPRIRLGMTARA